MSFKRALEIIDKNDIHMPKEFARLMWPDSPCWRKVYHVGNGATRGAGMWISGGSLLAKLAYRGLIRRPWSDDRDSYYSLTDKGREYLTKHSSQNN